VTASALAAVLSANALQASPALVVTRRRPACRQVRDRIAVEALDQYDLARPDVEELGFGNLYAAFGSQAHGRVLGAALVVGVVPPLELGDPKSALVLHHGLRSGTAHADAGGPKARREPLDLLAPLQTFETIRDAAEVGRGGEVGSRRRRGGGDGEGEASDVFVAGGEQPVARRHRGAADGPLVLDKAAAPAVRRGIRQDAREPTSHGGSERSLLKRQAFRVEGEGPAMLVPPPGTDIVELAVGRPGPRHDETISADDVRGIIRSADMDVDVRGHRGSIRACDAHGGEGGRFRWRRPADRSRD
jgi:hypothetical protein